MICYDILQTIGNTPMVRINRLNPNPNVTVYAKIEGGNPGGSIKDRIALMMVQHLEAQGRLTPGKTLIEPTSGNTGIALAMIGAIRGYSVEIVMSEAVSKKRITMIEAFGAKVTLTDPDKGTDGAIVKARSLVKEFPDRYVMPDQFSNESNKIAHYETTALEIWRQTGGHIDCFVSSIGTSGTLMGVGAYLKRLNPKVRIVSAEPERGHYIQGLKNMDEAIVPAIYDRSKIDRIIRIDTEEAFETARRIVRNEGVFVGMSSGAAMLAAQTVAKESDSGVIVTIFPDRGEKYLSTGLFRK